MINSAAFLTNLCSCVVNNLLSGHITFVANEQFVDIFAGIAVDFSEPLTDIVERFLPKSQHNQKSE